MSVLLATLALLATPQDTTYDLLWKPQPGQKQVYELKMEGTLDEVPFIFKVEVYTRIVEVSKNGDYAMGSQFKNGYVKFAGMEDKYDQDKEEVQHYNHRGDLLDKPSGEPTDGDRVGEIIGQTTDFLPPRAPIKMGDKWTREFPKNPALKLPAASVRYELASLTKTSGVDAFVIPYSYAQSSGTNPVKAKGILLLDRKDFSVLSIKADVENMVFGEGVPPARGHLEMVRKGA